MDHYQLLPCATEPGINPAEPEWPLPSPHTTASLPTQQVARLLTLHLPSQVEVTAGTTEHLVPFWALRDAVQEHPFSCGTVGILLSRSGSPDHMTEVLDCLHFQMGGRSQRVGRGPLCTKSLLAGI